ncbi:MAG: hypothetical protein BGP25_15805 [Lysobacterales bacterium 63-13]|nr:MAG: hypothetical protein BGP25_15805 [Xanthomonadales bacterium 63-13]
MRRGLSWVLLMASAPVWASGADHGDNCDQQVIQADGSMRCELRPDGQFAPVAPGDHLTLDFNRVPAEHVLGCSDVTDPRQRPREGLTSAQRALLDSHSPSSGVLMDATINNRRHVFVVAAEDALRWEANPDRVTLTLPGDPAPTVALVDAVQGPTRYCMESKVFVVHAKAQRAASVQIQSNPVTQEVASGGTAIFQIKIINNGTVALAPVSVTSTAVSTCARTVSSLGASSTYTYSCNKGNVLAPFSNTVTATGQQGGGSVSATATSSVTLPGGGPPPDPSGAAAYTVCRLPWVQYAKAGESARWQFKVTNNTSTALSAVNLIETTAPQCNKTLASVAIGQTVVWECAQAITPGPPIRIFTVRASSQQSDGTSALDWEFTNVVITDYIHVDGFDGCVANGSSNELCLPDIYAAPRMRHPSP